MCLASLGASRSASGSRFFDAHLGAAVTRARAHLTPQGAERGLRPRPNVGGAAHSGARDSLRGPASWRSAARAPWPALGPAYPRLLFGRWVEEGGAELLPAADKRNGLSRAVRWRSRARLAHVCGPLKRVPVGNGNELTREQHVSPLETFPLATPRSAPQPPTHTHTRSQHRRRGWPPWLCGSAVQPGRPSQPRRALTRPAGRPGPPPDPAFPGP